MQRTFFARTNWLYFGVLILLVAASGIVPLLGIDASTTSVQLIETMVLEIVVIGLPALLFVILGAEDKRDVLKIKQLSFIDVVLVGGMAVSGYGVITFVNLLWYLLLSQIGQPMAQDIPTIATGGDFLLGIVAMAVVPAFCEEMMFRGVIFHAYESRFRWIPAVVMVGAMFAVYHLLLLTIPSILILGIMITYTVYRTRSIWAGVLYHFVHNTLSVCLTYVQNLLADKMGEGMFAADLSQLSGDMLLAGIVSWAVIGAFCLGLFGVFTWLLYYRTRDIERPVRIQARPSFLEWLPVALAGLLIVYMWVAQVVTMVVA